MTDDLQGDSLSLKWGTLKSWDIHSETGRALLKRYHEIGASIGAIMDALSALDQLTQPKSKCVVCDGRPPSDAPCTGCGERS